MREGAKEAAPLRAELVAPAQAGACLSLGLPTPAAAPACAGATGVGFHAEPELSRIES
jgi:hypothetical protein